MNATVLTVRDGMDWAEFFVSERPPWTQRDNSTVYSATFACVSSFGVFGFHWSHMGKPFKQFAANIGDDYLLSKIGKRTRSNQKIVDHVRRRILESRRANSISRQIARDAWDAVETIEIDYSGDAVGLMLYEDGDIASVPIEWSDIETEEWDTQSVCFVKKMWPKFVEAYCLGEKDTSSQQN